MAAAPPRPGLRYQAPRKVISLAISSGARESQAPQSLTPRCEPRPSSLPVPRGLPVDDSSSYAGVRKLLSKCHVGKKTDLALRALHASGGPHSPNAGEEAGSQPGKGWKKVRKVLTKARSVYALTEGLGLNSTSAIDGPRWTGGEAAEIDASLVQRCTVASRSGQCVDLNFHFKFLHQISGLTPYQDHLKTLDLSSNNIRRIENLDGMKKLRVLKLTACQLTRIQHLENCGSLAELHLQDNFIGQVEGLSQLRSLEYLNLNMNKILALGHGLNQLVKLRELHLDRNQLLNLDGLSSLRALTTLCASNNRISKVTALQLRGADKLDELSLAGNRLQDLSFLINSASKALTLPCLASLLLSGNLLDKSALVNAPEMPQLTELDLSANQIGQLPSTLKSRWPLVEIFDVSSNKLAGPDGLKPLEELPSLRELAINGNPIVAPAEDLAEELAEDAVKNLLKSLPALQYLDGQKLARPAVESALESTQESVAADLGSNAEDLNGTFRFTQTELASVHSHEQRSKADVKTPLVVSRSPAREAAVRPLQKRFADEGKVIRWQEQAMESFAAIEAMITKTIKKSEEDLQDMTDYLERAERVLQRERELRAKKALPFDEIESPPPLGEDGEEEDLVCNHSSEAALSRDVSPIRKAFLSPLASKENAQKGHKGVKSIEPTELVEAAADPPKEERGSSASSSGIRPHPRPQKQPRQYCTDLKDLRTRAAMLAELDEEIATLQTEGPAAEVEEEIMHSEAPTGQDEASEETVPIKLAEQRLRSVREVRKQIAACQPGLKDKASRLRLPPAFPPFQEWQTDPVRPLGAAPQGRKLVRVRAC